MSNVRWTLDRWVPIITLICSASAFIFGVGVQWAKTVSIEAKVDAQAASMNDYLRADVYAADQRRLSDAIDRLVESVNLLIARNTIVDTSGSEPRQTPAFRSGAR